ncbi:MAG: hypothetical protein Q4F60_03330, partial [Candidatus Saccharibacteria bacterium]|nr:hypothetical protein [Candidatus Saccharibacteria bacterium]
MEKNTKVKAGSVLAGVAVMAEMMSPGTVMAATQNHNNKPYITNQVTELLIQEIDEANGTIKVVVSENGLTEGSREKVVENESGEVTLEKIVDISDWTYRQLNVMVATGISDADLYILTSGRGMGPTIFNQTYETVDIAKDTPTVLNETEVGALRSSEEKELVYSLGVSYYFAETGRNRTWYIPGRINYSSCFEGLENMTGVVCEAETYEGEDGMLMVRYKPKEGTGVPVDTNENGGESGDSGGEAGDSGNDDLGENSGGDSEGTGLDNGNSAGAGSGDGNSVNTGNVGDNTDGSGSGGDSSGGEGGNN